MTGWRLIDDGAPLDGTPVIGGGPGWAGEVYHEPDRQHEGWYEAGSHWTDAHEGQCYPTHWQPMPEPPSPHASPQASQGE